MKEFFSRHSYIVIWILSLMIIGSIAILIIQLDTITTGTLGTPTRLGAEIPAAPTSPATPGVTLAIVKSVDGNYLHVTWDNLPDGTTELNIFRSKTGTTGTWSLWKTISLTSDELTNGSADIALGSSSEDGYSFYVQADSGGGGDTSSTTIFWDSSSTVPIVTTSTPPDNPPPSSPSSSPPNPPPPQNPPPDNPTPSSSPSSSPSSNPGSGNNSTTTTPPPPPQGPGGDPYYNPQVQITGYGTAPGDFWVQHANQSIEIGWQNIPTGVDTITVARSTNSTGPWDTIITQQNPGSTGSYSLQLVDNSLNDPYYYEMTAFQSGTVVATYGPVYLAGD